MFFNKKLKRRIINLEDCLQRIEDMAIMAVVDGYSPKDSPAEHRFECIGRIATTGLNMPDSAADRGLDHD